MVMIKMETLKQQYNELQGTPEDRRKRKIRIGENKKEELMVETGKLR